MPAEKIRGKRVEEREAGDEAVAPEAGQENKEKAKRGEETGRDFALTFAALRLLTSSLSCFPVS